MGYTHYLYRPEQIKNWDKIIIDTKQAHDLVSSLGIDIVHGSGEPNSSPEFSNELICFNGSNQQMPNKFTTKNNFGIAWSNQKKEQFLEVRRLLDRDGSCETLFISRKYDFSYGKDINYNGNYFTFCKTRYYPYDILVMSVYLIVKIHDNRCIIASDGQREDWQLAIAIIEKNLQKDSQILSQFLEENL
ncbi:MAG: hypothetical protein F6K08_00130 [Okeania sp. SIO1H6]|nr:hypothetical protein [Okeania sp. SIO1H6]